MSNKFREPAVDPTSWTYASEHKVRNVLVACCAIVFVLHSAITFVLWFLFLNFNFRSCISSVRLCRTVWIIWDRLDWFSSSFDFSISTENFNSLTLTRFNCTSISRSCGTGRGVASPSFIQPIHFYAVLSQRCNAVCCRGHRRDRRWTDCIM